MYIEANKSVETALHGQKPMNISAYVLRISLTAALAGFIFGFDTVVISGANLPIKQLWHTSPLFHGFFIMSMALWGTVVGAIFGGIPTQKWGRKKVLVWIGILFSASALGTALAPDPYTFSFFRFIGGLGIGVSSVAAPTYISEISTPANRGKLVALYQFNIVFGILVAFLSNYFLQGVGGANDWRYMLGALAVPSLIYSSLVIGVPESPRWLITNKNDTGKAKKILSNLGIADPEAETAAIVKSYQHETSAGHSSKLFSAKYKNILWLAFMVAFFNQVSGINFILYYAPEILERAGLAAKESLFNSIAIGGTNLIFTFVGLYLIDKLGRKTLLAIGSFGYILSLGMVAWCFYSHAGATLLMSFLLLFIAAHAIGQGAVIWVFISEIFPNKVRAVGQSFGASIHWVFAALITLITPVFLDKDNGIFKDNPWPIFAFFAFMMVLQLVWVFTKVPETKGVSLEDLEKKLVKV
ncbi:sugar porter family MFS transporter [Flavisolibacter ginsengisoli]|jgi:sugar porter (SP) family MFS transporter|uniref:MFS transporter, sugar porter (SP) family n=1 Tax=Flavisolibacter ginsengisoli DSM 18119 TaxID=1121884 RepID=A0A1M4Z6F8_9BACT|nr:sugar porter family MFS transporter [Flavisolibacter ginsengisoli]SHF13604.1 MFS transporter, sugar porter (SP) family [Flavisolibacter ginsengisoli DSM 18119]